MLRRSLALSLLLIAASATAAHEVTQPTYGSSFYFDHGAIVATNGVGFLTVWTTPRGAGGQHAYGSLVDEKGSVATPIAFLVAPHAIPLGAFSNGNDYLVLLADDPFNQISVLRIATVSG